MYVKISILLFLFWSNTVFADMYSTVNDPQDTSVNITPPSAIVPSTPLKSVGPNMRTSGIVPPVESIKPTIKSNINSRVKNYLANDPSLNQTTGGDKH